METGWIEDNMYFAGDDGAALIGWHKLDPPDGQDDDVDPFDELEGEKWYYSGLVLLATYCLCMPVSWVLTFLRYKNIERQSESYKKRTKIAVGIQVGLLAVSIIISIIIKRTSTHIKVQY